MFQSIFTYEFSLHDGSRVIGAATGTSETTAAAQPAFGATTSIKCDLETVNVIHLLDYRPEAMKRIIKVFWNRDLFGKAGDPSLLLAGPCEVALIEFFEGQVFIGRSEPTLDDRLGLSIVTDKGRTLFAGVGDLLEVPAATKYLQFTGTMDLVYPFKAASPSGCAHLRPYVRKDKLPEALPPDGGSLRAP